MGTSSITRKSLLIKVGSPFQKDIPLKHLTQQRIDTEYFSYELKVTQQTYSEMEEKRPTNFTCF